MEEVQGQSTWVLISGPRGGLCKSREWLAAVACGRTVTLINLVN
jgi:hypothetical protein